jgi:hypothetical protein
MPLVFCLFLLPGCISNNTTPTEQTAAPEPVIEAPIVTVWVHGTRFWPDHILSQLFLCESGLNKPDRLPDNYRLKQICGHLAKTERFGQHVYLYGWSGKLSFATRKQTGIELHHALQKLIIEYTATYHVAPRIKIITHSHGGNVLLNCIAYAQETQSGLVFDECILLACPVQQETAHIITSPLIGKAYSLFSSMDSIQILDPQGIYRETTKQAPLLSERLFPYAANLKQAQLKTSYRGLMHIDFIRDYFVKLLPAILDALDAHDGDHTPGNHAMVKLDTRKSTVHVAQKRPPRRSKRSNSVA